MGATNSTTYYQLSQFIATDKPAWLQDYNGDMLKIDTAINGAKVAADAAQLAADAAQGDATTALESIQAMTSDIATIQSTLGTAVGNINTINSLIGNGTPTTTDQTIIGAINEINAKVDDDVDHLSDLIDTIRSHGIIRSWRTVQTVTADGTKTIQQLLGELYTKFSNDIANRDTNQQVLPTVISTNHFTYALSNTHWIQCGSALGLNFRGTESHMTSQGIGLASVYFNPTISEEKMITLTDSGNNLIEYTSTAPTAGAVLQIEYWVGETLSRIS